MFWAHGFTTTYAVISHIQNISPQVLKEEKDDEKKYMKKLEAFTYKRYIFIL